MDCVVSPVDHKLPLADEDVKTILPPLQNCREPPEELMDKVGKGLTVTNMPLDDAEEHPPLVTVTK